ncbi:MAG: ethylbenzene dehydrogenase-related protein [Myxococcota bacterium]
MRAHKSLVLVLSTLLAATAHAGELRVVNAGQDVSDANPQASYWQKAPVETVVLTGQPMITPRPATTTTTTVQVQAVHDGQWVAFRLRWKDPERSGAGRLGEFSDAAAIQFPIKEGPPPPVFMGTKDNPVHIYHWRAQYQDDRLKGKPGMRELYPNMAVDLYPLEFSDPGHVGRFDEAETDTFSPGRASGNPQSFVKTGVDEIYAEGFSTSSVQAGNRSVADGRFENGEWTLVIARKMTSDGGSKLESGKKGYAAFAIWQGGQGEVGSRKSVTMQWIPFDVETPREARR